MSRLKTARPFREVMFTHEQMFIARGTRHFESHRHFIAWLFEKQHRVRVIDFDKLRYDYNLKTIENGKSVSVTKVTGYFGESIYAM